MGILHTYYVSAFECINRPTKKTSFYKLKFTCLNKSVVCTCSGAYMRAEIRNENLVVCLSEYLPIYVIISLKCCLGLPVVHEVSGVVTMKSIDMYIIHDSSLLLCFSNISELVFTLAFSRKRQKLQPAPAVSLHQVPTEVARRVSVLVLIEF